jgi:hypothetical protein
MISKSQEETDFRSGCRERGVIGSEAICLRVFNPVLCEEEKMSSQPYLPTPLINSDTLIPNPLRIVPRTMRTLPGIEWQPPSGAEQVAALLFTNAWRVKHR